MDCDICAQPIGVYGWQRSEMSSAAPRAVCATCMEWPHKARLSVLLAAARAVVAHIDAEHYDADIMSITYRQFYDDTEALRVAVDAVGREEE
jgi:hypothetical protein